LSTPLSGSFYCVCTLHPHMICNLWYIWKHWKLHSAWSNFQSSILITNLGEQSTHQHAIRYQHLEQVYKVDILMGSTWKNFLVYFEGTLWTRVSLREKRMNIMPTPLRVGGILCYVGQILAQLNHGRITIIQHISILESSIHMWVFEWIPKSRQWTSGHLLPSTGQSWEEHCTVM
jgi:hypothetical protein